MLRKYEKIHENNRSRVNDFIRKHWYTTTMVLRGKEIDMAKTEGFCCCQEGEIVGLITYMVHDHLLEITSLDSLSKNQGIGSGLLEAVIQEARKRNISKIVLITTNDNTCAMRFYQKRGFDMTCLFRNAMDIARTIKPEIPLLGNDSIPLRHEIEFELQL